MYVYGLGLKQNKKIAKKWFAKACENGVKEGCHNYNIMKQQDN